MFSQEVKDQWLLNSLENVNIIYKRTQGLLFILLPPNRNKKKETSVSHYNLIPITIKCETYQHIPLGCRSVLHPADHWELRLPPEDWIYSSFCTVSCFLKSVSSIWLSFSVFNKCRISPCLNLSVMQNLCSNLINFKFYCNAFIVTYIIIIMWYTLHYNMILIYFLFLWYGSNTLL